ncbi:MAG: hybrid sensor histidine kinase/response regulator [SAR324 cluster bacterium]|nr:hybrid sensor histidine kinase/response regulator [SAR324 cluster bacterium]
MTGSQANILVMADAEAGAHFASVLASSYTVLKAATSEEAIGLLQDKQGLKALFAVPSEAGRRVLSHCGRHQRDIVCVMIAHQDEHSQALEAVRTGEVMHFVSNPCTDEEILQSAHQALNQSRLQGEREDLLNELLAIKGDPEGAAMGVTASPRKDPEELERLKNDALTVAAHDLRSPMSVILGYSNVLLEIEENLSDQGRRMVERVRATCSRLLILVERILNVTALEAGQIEVIYSEIRLSEILQEAVDDFRGMIEDQDITLRTEVVGNEKPYLLDRARAGQALQNLVSNAIKFIGEQGLIEIRCTGEPGLVTFSVSDNGGGLTPEQIEHVFERFSRFMGDSQQGSGLGLAIAKAAAESHGGKMWVESTPGQGSTFYFTLVPKS